jgi:hypothetical protein
VLAAKPDQAHVAWYNFIFRLCVSYRKVNAVTRPFRFPTPRCDDAVRGIRGNYFITKDLDCGYWQVKLDKMSQEKTAFYVPDGKKHWKVMPMGATNAHPFFVAMAERMRFEWNQLAKTRGIKLCSTTMSRRGKDDPDAKTIVDDVLLYAYSAETLLEYFEMVLVVLQHYRVTVKLRKCRFIQTIAEFVGMDILSHDNTPAKSKDEAFQKMTYSISFTDLRGFIGFLGFYQEFIPLYEVRIDPFRRLLKDAPPPGSLSKEEEASLLEQEWKDEHKKLFDALRSEASSSPMLARPSEEKRFCLRTDWSSLGRGAVLAQPRDDPAAIEAMDREIAGDKCEFYLTISNTAKRLRPISFISKCVTTQSEKTLHSYMGEAGTGVWAMEKFRFYLFGKEFTWICDCSGLINFFETNELPTHQAQRWKLFMLQFNFTIVHRLDRMTRDVDMLSRYNNWVKEMRDTDKQGAMETFTKNSQPETAQGHKLTALMIQPAQAPPLVQYRSAQKIGPIGAPLSELASATTTHRNIWTINLPHSTEESITITGIQGNVMSRMSTQINRTQGGIKPIQQAQNSRAAEVHGKIHWIMAEFPLDETDANVTTILELIAVALRLHSLKGIILFLNDARSDKMHPIEKRIRHFPGLSEWYSGSAVIQNTTHAGGGIEKATRMVVIHEEMEPITATTTTITLHLLPANMNEALDSRPDIIDDYDWPNATEMNPDTAEQYNVRLSATTTMFEEGQTLTKRVFDPEHPGPSIDNATQNQFHEAPFGALLYDEIYGTFCQGIRPHEFLRLMGEPDDIQAENEWTNDEFYDRMKWRVPTTTLQGAAQTIFLTELATVGPVKDLFSQPRGQANLPVLLNRANINKWTTIPLPTKHKWQQATNQDHDLKHIMEAIKSNNPVKKDELNEKAWFTEWKGNHLEEEGGLIYHYEAPKRSRLRQLRTRVVPTAFITTILTACHTSPISGHTDKTKTYYRVATRYWWPTMTRDITEFVLSCAYCRLSNATSHEAQSILQAIETQEPFDVIFLDVWTPGDFPAKW